MNDETVRKELFWLSDADNTLWDTDSLYRQAQLGLLANVEKAILIEGPRERRLEFVRAIDQALAKRDHRGLKYPVSMLVSAVSQVLRGQSIQRATNQAARGSLALSRAKMDQIASEFYSALSRCPLLRSGVASGLNALNRAGATVMVITEGDKERIERLLMQTGLRKLVTSVIAARKSVQLYTRLSQLRAHSMNWMIGDQVERDVFMAAQAGMRTAFFPGGFQPPWNAQRMNMPNGCIEVTDYQQAVSIALWDRS
jgi:putative hydrolase of the HAD superfamily